MSFQPPIIVHNVTVAPEVQPFEDDIQLTIDVEATRPIEAIDWKVVYVSNPYDDRDDQELDEIEVGPLPIGMHRIRLSAPAPDIMKIPQKDVLGISVMTLSGHYKGQEFVHIGYYVNNELSEEAQLAAVTKSHAGTFGDELGESIAEEDEEEEESGDDEDEDEDEDEDRDEDRDEEDEDEDEDEDEHHDDYGDEGEAEGKSEEQDEHGTGTKNIQGTLAQDTHPPHEFDPRMLPAGSIIRSIAARSPRVTRFAINWSA